MRVLFVNQEIEPFVVGTTMASLGKKLPQQAQELGHEVRIFMPKFGVINERRNQLHEVIRLSGLNLVINGEDHPLVIKVASLPSMRLQVYFIDNEDFFQRRGIFHDEVGDPYEDNDMRAFFFAKGVLETVKKLHWAPDLIHCNGWFTSFIPCLLRTVYSHDAMFSKLRILYTLYEDTPYEPVGTNFAKTIQPLKLGDRALSTLAPATHEALTRQAVTFSDAVGFGDSSVEPKMLTYVERAGKLIYDCTDPANLEEVYARVLEEELVP